MMKKTINKLVLRRETVRTLIEEELRRAEGGHDDPRCTSISIRASGCAAVDVDPKPSPVD
jgi:hypothetical protein